MTPADWLAKASRHHSAAAPDVALGAAMSWQQSIAHRDGRFRIHRKPCTSTVHALVCNAGCTGNLGRPGKLIYLEMSRGPIFHHVFVRCQSTTLVASGNPL
jgi:hypothetical protein